ncbi:MAG: 4-(cytidine 5'-diphospho)-2-C-methyl-D-erythritol kinase [Rhizobiales bacterium]|nr:4-(cytidine 5'-diphospho)-2-C-methyl-D-erythritol kinase [Hyphomicrobiales bacterium]
MPEARVIEVARAKINLALHILGRRADGYHALDSIVAFADIGDRLTLERSPHSQCEIRYLGPFGEALAALQGNIILSAEHELRSTLAVAFPKSSFALEKNLPIAAGIGGGSADAAAALRGLVKLHGLECSSTTLSSVARKIGADVPVCLLSRTCRMRGTGEILEEVHGLGEHHAVLVNPGIELSTSAVFARLGLERQSSAYAPIELPLMLGKCRNDLTDAAIALAPQIKSVLSMLERQAGATLVRMSGSGPTCFGLFDASESAAEAAARIAADRPAWWCRATRIGN